MVFKEDFGQASERAFKEQIIKQTFPQINKHGNSNNIPWRIQERQRVGGIAYLIRGNPSQCLPSGMGIPVHAVQKMTIKRKEFHFNLYLLFKKKVTGKT